MELKEPEKSRKWRRQADLAPPGVHYGTGTACQCLRSPLGGVGKETTPESLGRE